MVNNQGFIVLVDISGYTKVYKNAQREKNPFHWQEVLKK